jgi:hypothetical protein
MRVFRSKGGDLAEKITQLGATLFVLLTKYDPDVKEERI